MENGAFGIKRVKFGEKESISTDRKAGCGLLGSSQVKNFRKGAT